MGSAVLPVGSAVRARPPGTVWVASLLVGMAAAMTASTGAGLLLYDESGLVPAFLEALADGRAGDLAELIRVDGRGFGRAAVVVLGTWALSLVAGLWLGRDDEGADASFSLGRGWGGLFAALVLAAAFSVLWESVAGARTAVAGQGLGLAFTIALPAYCAGAVWRRLAVFASLLGARVRRQVPVGALLGLGAGVALASVVLGRSVLAVTAFLGAVVLASAGARTLGWIVDRVPVRVRVVADPLRPGIRFAEWRTEALGRVVRILETGSADQGRWLVDPPARGDWRLRVRSALAPGSPVLFVGAASWFALDDGRPWRLHEPDAGVRALAARAFGWGEGAWAAEPLAPGPGTTVVADGRALLAPDGAEGDGNDAPLIALLRSGADRIWIRDSGGVLAAAHPAAWRRAGWIEFRYRFRSAGREGPPRIEPASADVVLLQAPGRPFETDSSEGLGGDALPLAIARTDAMDGARG